MGCRPSLVCFCYLSGLLFINWDSRKWQKTFITDDNSKTPCNVNITIISPQKKQKKKLKHKTSKCCNDNNNSN